MPRQTAARTRGAQTLSSEIQERLAAIQRILEDPPVDVPTLASELTSLASAISIEPGGELGPVKPGKPVNLALLPDPKALPAVPSSGRPISIEASITWSFQRDGTTLKRDRDWSADAIASPTITAFLKPRVVEAPRESSHTRLLEPSVELTLSMRLPGQPLPVSSNKVVLPRDNALPNPTRLPVEPVVVPTLLALFRHKRFKPQDKGFDGFVLCVFKPVDGRSPAKVLADTARDLPLEAGNTLLARFPDLPDVLGEVGRLGGENVLGFLQKQLAEQQPIVRVHTATTIDELSKIGMPTGQSGLDAGNAASSLIFLGVGGRTVRCWSGKRGNKRDPFFALRTGAAGFALIEDLHHDEPPTLPDQQCFQLGKKPGAANSFGDAISAIEFL